MKKLQMRRNRKLVDLVELVRNRLRFQPYRFHSNTNIPSRSNMRVLQTTDSSRFASTEDLVKQRRQRRGRRKRPLFEKRRAARSRNPTEGEPQPSGSVSVTPGCSCRRTFRDETSQTSIPGELRHLLIDDTQHSDEEEDEENNSKNKTSHAKPVEQITNLDQITLRLNPITANEQQRTSNEQIIDEQATKRSRSCSSELRTSDDLLTVSLAVPMDADRIEHDTENKEDHKETEDGEDTERTEETLDIVPGEDRHENEPESAHVLHDRDIAVGTDEEAGGDGHHNNSVIEIEITLTSGNDSNTNSEDENDTDGLGDEESEDI